MIIIGLCGNSGSGKGTVCKSFLKYGIPSVDADLVYRELTSSDSPLLNELAQKFGNEILNSDGSFNRKALANIVFSDKSGKLLSDLNKITHSRVIAEAEKRMDKFREEGKKAVIFDAPLLFESGFDKKCDILIAVTASKEEKIRRIIQRDGIDYETAEKRLNSQYSEEFLKSNADYVIDNIGDTSDIEFSVKKIINNIFCEV